MLDIQQWLFESVFQPVMLWLDMTQYLEDGYSAVAWFLWGLLQIAIIALVIVPLERVRPVEPVVDKATVRVDVLYTLIHRLGVFRLAIFLLLAPLLDEAFGLLRSGSLYSISLGTFHLDQLWPSVTDGPIASLILYVIVFDFFDYCMHRAQHGWSRWWALHSLHHAQRQMTVWSDNRNHMLDDVIRDVLMVCLAFAIGVSPSQFVFIVAITQTSESLQHANLRLSFGRIGERLWVSPRFHRLHHGVNSGFGHNFGVLLPWWDQIFGTALFQQHDQSYEPTGVLDQNDYGRGFWEQQWLGLKRMVRG